MQLSPRALNRTLLHRQGLLARQAAPVLTTVHRLVGLQAQETLAPYLSLAARLDPFDPREVSAALDRRELVRMIVMRGTIHLLTPDDALSLREFVQPRLDQERRSSQVVRDAVHVDAGELRTAVASALANGPLPQAALGTALAAYFPDEPASALAQLARVDCPLVQAPPRGQWRAAGGVVYDLVDAWLGRPLVAPDVQQIVRRYLRASGPATAADVTAWSGVARLGPVLAGMEDLERHSGPDRRPVYDVAGGEVVEDASAPVRLLGTYDNLWLSHAVRDRVTAPARRKRWMGANGGVAASVYVDGWLEGLWRVVDGRPVVVEEFRAFTAAERRQLDDELARVEALLAVPPASGRASGPAGGAR